MTPRAGLVVVGGGPAGHAAATAYAEAGGPGAVVLLADEGRHPYARPPLSKDLLRGTAEAGALPLEDDPAAYAQRGVEVRPAQAAGLDPTGREVILADGGRLGFGACVLATGAAPIRPPVDGSDAPHVHVLRTADHALALRDAAVSGAHAVVVGSGFIGCEAAASLRARGCAVTLVSQEPAPQAARLGGEVAARLAGWLAELGVDARYEAELATIEPGRVHLVGGGAALEADLVLLAAGVAPRAGLAERAGLALAEDGEIAADAAMRTSAPAVFAAGDCCRARHALAGRPLHVEHWGDALAQGEVAGTVAAGGDAAWSTVPGFWSTIGDRTLKYAAWGDGFDAVRVADHGDGAFTAWYGAQGRTVGVLAHARDEDYEAGRELIERGDPLP